MPTAGLAIGALASGLLVQAVGASPSQIFAVLTVLTVISVIIVILSPETNSGRPGVINNAGIAHLDDLTDRGALQRHLDFNVLGTFDVIRAFLPAMEESEGTIVNLSSLTALAAVPMLPAYSVAKAAAFALAQALRALVAPSGVSVHVVLAGTVDTDIVRDMPLYKAAPAVADAGFLDGPARD